MNCEVEAKDVGLTTKLVLLVFALGGLLLIAASIILAYHRDAALEYWTSPLRELGVAFSRELGIVLLSVFTVSLLYEVWLGERYLRKFHSSLRTVVKEGETNAAACARLGITQIFATRTDFEREHPLDSFVIGLGDRSHLRFIGMTLFNLLNKSDVLKRAIQQGVQLELCLLDPTVASESIKDIPSLEIDDIRAALAVFRKVIAGWVTTDKPRGSVELRWHRTPLFDSFVLRSSSERNWGVLDLSFGRDLKGKRVITLDAGGVLGGNLAERYATIWNNATTVFKYADKQITVDNMHSFAAGRPT